MILIQSLFFANQEIKFCNVRRRLWCLCAVPKFVLCLSLVRVLYVVPFLNCVVCDVLVVILCIESHDSFGWAGTYAKVREIGKRSLGNKNQTKHNVWLRITIVFKISCVKSNILVDWHHQIKKKPQKNRALLCNDVYFLTTPWLENQNGLILALTAVILIKVLKYEVLKQVQRFTIILFSFTE